MKMVVFGSLNIDKTYSLEDFVRPGQTVSARKMEQFCGGKGFNQAIALRRAGNEVHFAGAVGQDGQMLLDALDQSGIRRECVKITAGATGHAIIQLDAAGQNCIIILAGANGEITPEDVEHTLSRFAPGDLIVLQNEISCVPLILRRAREMGMTVAFNPSPYDKKIADCDISCVDYLLVNETEGEAMTGAAQPEAMLDALRARYPHLNVVLTLGGDGAMYQNGDGQRFTCAAHPVQTVDTTAAGDTFTGYFLSGILGHGQAQTALRTAAVAAGIAVSRRGAEPSIPMMDEVAALL
ncbi:MAG: ribokinase [Clostridiales bacterium]|nr:ribokinase [Clostridiales bacterium]